MDKGLPTQQIHVQQNTMSSLSESENDILKESEEEFEWNCNEVNIFL